MYLRILDIKRGQRFWECERGMNEEYEALEDAYTSGTGHHCLRARHVEHDYTLTFVSHPNESSYAPKLYTCRQYATPSDLN